MSSVGVFLGSGSPPQQYSLATESLGSTVAKLGHSLVCGAGGGGLMGKLIDSALAEGGEVLGILPVEVAAQEIPHFALRNVCSVETVSERKRQIRERADLILVLPGGVGTIDELFEAFALKKIGLFSKPIGLLNINNFFQPLIRQFDFLVSEGFAKEEHRSLITCGSDPVHLLDQLLLEFELGKRLPMPS